MDLVINESTQRIFKVLVVEDEPNSIEHILASTRRMLRKQNGQLVHEFATSLSEAADVIRSTSFDLCIVDMGMPEKKGGVFYEDGGAQFIREMQKGEYGTGRARTKFMVVTAQDLDLQPHEIDKEQACLGVYSKLRYRPLEEVFQKYYSESANEEEDVERNRHLYIDNPSYYVELDDPETSNKNVVLDALSKNGLQVASEVFRFRMSTKKPVSYEVLASSLLVEKTLLVDVPFNADTSIDGAKQFDSLCVFKSGKIRSFGDQVTVQEGAQQFRVEFSNIADFIDPDAEGVEEDNGDVALRSAGFLIVVECIL